MSSRRSPSACMSCPAWKQPIRLMVSGAEDGEHDGADPYAREASSVVLMVMADRSTRVSMQGVDA